MVHEEHQALDQVATAQMMLCVSMRPSRGGASVQPIHVLRCRFLSSNTRHLQLGKALEQGSAPCARDLASTARDKARSYLNEVIDFCAADIIAMRSEKCSVTCDTLVQRESHRLVHQRTWQSWSENPLRWRVRTVTLAELQAQVTVVVSHVTRCICSATNLTLNSSIIRLACIF